MEAQLEDINSGSTLKEIKQVEDTIIDCAKNFKKNDATFNITTLPILGAKLVDLMNNYTEVTNNIVANQEAFSKLNDQMKRDYRNATHTDEEGGQYYEIDEYVDKFVETKEQIKARLPSETEAIRVLRNILQLDEEIQVQPPCRQIPKDPISRADIKVAVKSKKCGHTYDKESIEGYIAQKQASKRLIRCPQAGCTNQNLTIDDLIPDEEINNLIQNI